MLVRLPMEGNGSRPRRNLGDIHDDASMMTPVRRIVVLVIAMGASVLAFLLTRSALRSNGGADHPDFYCYTLRKAWACAYTRPECEARLAREQAGDILTRCRPHYEEILGP